jgi:hypothetical protein
MALKLKAAGLTLLAVLVLGGAAAQGAAANVEHSFTSKKEPTELTGSGGPHEWKLGEVTVKCAKSTVSGYLATVSADQMNLTPNYKECTLSSKLGFFFAAWENTGCKTAFDSDTSPNINTIEKEDGFVNLDCGHIFHSTLSAVIEKEPVYLEFFDTHPEEVPVNQEMHGATYSVIQHESLIPDEILIQAHILGIRFICKGAKCVKLGLKEGTNENGTTIGSFLVKGYSDTAHTEQVGLGLSTP